MGIEKMTGRQVQEGEGQEDTNLPKDENSKVKTELNEEKGSQEEITAVSAVITSKKKDYDFIKLKGNVDKVEEFLKNSSIYLHSAYSESFGLVLLEAMATGLPCIAIDAKGNRDILKNEFNGFLLMSHDPELFAGKIISLIENPDLYHKFSTNAYEFSKKFDIKVYLNTLINFYKKILPVKK